jgi:hypothetical protein
VSPGSALPEDERDRGVLTIRYMDDTRDLWVDGMPEETA